MFALMHLLVNRLTGSSNTGADFPESEDETEVGSSSSDESSVHTQIDGAPWKADPDHVAKERRIRAIRILLQRRGLPSELISQIFEYAGEGRVTSAERTRNLRYGNDANECYLRTMPLKSRMARNFVRHINLHIESRDQGWSSDPHTEWRGTVEGSWTWWELTLERGMQERVEVHRIEVQRNLHAVPTFQDFNIELGPECPIVRDAQQGDTLALWARTMYPGWVNLVREARISVITDWDS